MSWLKRALTITTMHEDSYYTVVDPGEFYEWRFTGSIPEDVVFTKRLPPSDSLAEGMLIATARLPGEVLEKKDFGFKTNQKVPTEIQLQAGQIQSPSELLQRYHRIKRDFEQSVDYFKAACQVRSYFASGDKEKHLYHIDNSMDDNVIHLHNYGATKDIFEELSDVRKALNKDSMSKKGRAHEMEEFRRFENAMTFIDNPSLPIDSGKIDLLLRIAQIKPKQTTAMDWTECYVQVSPEAHAIKELLDRYNSLSWVQASAFLSPSL